MTKYFIYIMLFVSIFSCSKKIEIDESKVFKLNRYYNISSLDPINARTQANTWACNLMYNSLVKIDNQLEIQPDIAKSWTISEDGKIYSFTLRNDVFFHKHEAFSFENEARLVLVDNDATLEKNNEKAGLHFSIKETREMITKIILHPNASAWFEDTVRKLINDTYQLDIPICKSSLVGHKN